VVVRDGLKRERFRVALRSFALMAALLTTTLVFGGVNSLDFAEPNER